MSTYLNFNGISEIVWPFCGLICSPSVLLKLKPSGIGYGEKRQWDKIRNAEPKWPNF